MFNSKILVVLICVIGVVGISYGMLKNNNLIFIMGLVFVSGGYLLIRKKIKDSIRNNP